jgi:hypothetical protein
MLSLGTTHRKASFHLQIAHQEAESMTKPTGRPRGRPRKDDSIPPYREPPPQEMPRADVLDDAFIEMKLLERTDPKRKTKLQADEETLKTLFGLAKLFCTYEETAAFLGVHRNTLAAFLRDNLEAKEAWEDGQQHAKISLRRKQLARCDKSDTMNIFLGKNYLDQRDEKHQTTSITHTVEELSEAQLMDLARQGIPEDKPRPRVLQ